MTEQRTRARGLPSRVSSDEVELLRVVAAAQQGDEAAFSTLVQSFQDRAVAYAASVLQDYDLAEDAAQEAFVDAHRLLPTLRDPAAFASWLRTIIFKHCDRFLRRKMHRVTSLAELGAWPTSDASASDTVEREEEADAIRRAIADLPEGQREVVLLHYMAGQPYATIADFLGVSTDAVKTRLYAARQTLRASIGQLIERTFASKRPSGDARFVRRVIAAAFPLQVFYLDDTGEKHATGATISACSAEVPSSGTWFIEPRTILDAKDWERVFELMKTMRIPGLAGGGQLTDDLLARLAKLDHITYLDLSNSRGITDRGLPHLGRLVGLKDLDLSCTTISDSGLAVARSLPRLRSVVMQHSRTISDLGIGHLEMCRELEHVDLMGTATGDDAIRSLSGKPNLRELSLGNAVSDDGLSELERFPGFCTWNGRPTMMSLMSGRARGTFLWINLAAPVTNDGIGALASLNGLTGLSLFGGASAGTFDASRSKVSADALRGLCELPRLEWLGCTGRLCNDEAMHHIARFRQLRFLMCQDTIAGDDGFTALAESPSVQYIWGRRCYGLTARGFSSLRGLSDLRGLAVSCKNVSHHGLGSLPLFPSLVELMPIDFGDDGFRHVGRCVNLEAIHSMYCTDTTDRATDQIQDLPKLRTYQAWNTRITDRSLNVLSGISSLEQLRFERCQSITDSGLRELLRLPRLRSVDLEGLPNVSLEGAAILSPKIRVNFTPT